MKLQKSNHRISQLDKKSWIDTSFSEAFELRRLRKRNEQLKIEHDKAVEIVVQGLKARTKAEALASSQQEEEKAKIATPIDKKELEKRKKASRRTPIPPPAEPAIRDRSDERRLRKEDRPDKPRL